MPCKVNIAALREVAAVLNKYEPRRYKIDDDGKIWAGGCAMHLLSAGDAVTLRGDLRSRRSELQSDIEKIDWLLEIIEEGEE